RPASCYTPVMDHAGRLSRLRAGLEENDLDSLLVTHLPNIRYLCGFTGSAAALLVAARGSVLFTDGRYRTQAKEEVEIKDASIFVARKSLRVAAVLKGKARLRSAPPLVERARMVKEAAEIQRIRRAVELGASLFQIARQKIRPGVSEVEVAAAMEYEARCAGAEGMSFATILASGTRSAIVHGRASDARIPRRGFVVSDFGVIL